MPESKGGTPRAQLGYLSNGWYERYLGLVKKRMPLVNSVHLLKCWSVKVLKSKLKIPRIILHNFLVFWLFTGEHGTKLATLSKNLLSCNITFLTVRIAPGTLLVTGRLFDRGNSVIVAQ